MKEYSKMTKAEQIAYRIAQNKAVVTPASVKVNTNMGVGTRREVGATGSSFLFQTVRGVL